MSDSEPFEAAAEATADEPADDVTTDRAEAPHARAALEHAVKAVVSQPDDVAIEVYRTRSGAVALDVSVAPGDMGRVIGKRGRVAQAIRSVVRAAATRDGVSVEVEFLE